MHDSSLRILVASEFGDRAAGPPRVVADASALVPAVLAAWRPEVRGLVVEDLEDLAPSALAARGVADPTAFLAEPDVAALDGRLRGLARLARVAAECGVDVAVTVVRTGANDLAQRLVEHALEEAEAQPGRAFDLAVVEPALGGRPGELDGLLGVARWCAALGTPLLAQLDPLGLGVRHALHLAALPDLPARLARPKDTALAALRADPAARWVALVLGRALGRPAWVDPNLPCVESFRPQRPETLPWMNGVWLAAAGAVRSLAAHRHLGAASGFAPAVVHADLGTAPAPGQPADVVTSMDVQFDDAVAAELLRHGVTPLVDRPQDGVAAFPLLTNAFRPDGPRLDRDTSLAHQAHAGQALRLLLQLEGEARERGASQETARWLERELGALYGGNDAASVAVALEDAAFHVELRPAWTLDGKPVEADLRLPIG